MKVFRKAILLLTLLGASLPLLSACSSSNTSVDGFKVYQQMEQFIDYANISGLNDELTERWLNPEGDKYIPYENLEGKNGILNVAAYSQIEPMCFMVDNKISGFCIDYLYRFALEYGYSLKLQDFNSVGAAIDSISSGKNLISGFDTSITEERLESVAFSKKYYEHKVVATILNKNKDKYNTPESLNGKKIGVIVGSAYRANVEKDIKDAQVVEYNSYSDAIQALRKDEIPAYYCNSTNIGYMKHECPDLTTAYVSETDPIGFLFKRFGIQTFKELEKSTIGDYVSSAYSTLLKERFPDGTIKFYDSLSSMTEALRINRIQAFVADSVLANQIAIQNGTVYPLHESLGTCDMASIFPKNESGNTHRNEFNKVLSSLEKEGTLSLMQYKWVNYIDDITETYIPYDTLPATNGTIKLAVDPTGSPFVFLKNNRLTGYEVELFYEYCKAYGYALNISQIDFNALIPALSTHDAAACMFSITEERKESVYFSDSYYTGDIVLVCQASSANNKSIWEQIGDSFYKTFVKEERWKLFLEGIGNTLLITICSILGGIIIGTILYMLCKDGNKVANILVKIYNSILHNIPMVVILMVFYYIFFGGVNLSGIFVSIIAFSCTFSTSIFAMLKLGVDSIDKGQYEAAYSLGYRKNQTFFKIILPQASRLFYPRLSVDIVSLLKDTAIVGYIAVMDLTKVSDIIRSRTYEAFFPLIASALIYFVLAIVLVQIVKLIQRLTDPRKKNPKSITKGIKIHD